MSSKITRILAMVLILAMALCGVSCSSFGKSTKKGSSKHHKKEKKKEKIERSEDSEQESTPESKPEFKPTEEITDRTLHVVTNAFFPPYEYYDGVDMVGIDIDVINEIGNRLDMDVEITDVDFDSIISDVKSDKTDVGIAGIIATEDRLQSVDFSLPYYTSTQVVIVRSNSPINSYDDLLDSDYKVGVKRNTSGDLYATDDIGDANVLRFSMGNDAILGLQNGSVDAVVIDRQIAVYYVDNYDNLKILSVPVSVEDFAICVSYDDPELLNDINEVIKEMQYDGTIDEIISNYIYAD